ncbi:glycosyltransferase family 4 protein [Kitasatospora sp. NBC_01287]|uniref:glycosyltransferase family 4 protein n=1 Tax=Kitasatospora sp. NBC_01287 TaxID=2903573 RepID=UPI00225C31DC|nr:glycosyltransferase family 4 protein [Kitasatospora sp. NBC_01287]MCX4745979.1 glycosyltransferase family 4 protein [Kitasatospora sp. NBC_01287]
MISTLVLTWISTARGGAEKSVAELAEALATQGVRVRLVWWRSGMDAAPAPAPAGVEVNEVDGWDGYRAAVHVMASNRRDSVIISTHRTAAADVIIARTTPVVAVLRGIVHPDRILRVLDPGTGRIMPVRPGQMPSTLLYQAHWVGISKAAAGSARHLPGVTSATTIYNGVHIPAQAPERTEKAPGEVLRIGVIARTVPWKRLEDLVYASSEPDLRHRVHVTVYGQPGSAQESLEKLVDTTGAPVMFHGYTTDLVERLAAADVLVSPSPEEGFGRCIIDGAAANIPAIVPDVGAGPEVVLDGLTGIVYPYAERGSLAAALARACENPNELARMGRVARARACALFNPQRCAAQYLEAAHHALAQRGAR